MTVTRKGSSTGITMRGPNLTDFDFEILEESDPNVTDPATTVETTEDDRVYEETDGGAYEDNRQLDPAILTGFGNGPTYESLDESIATVDALGKVTQVTNGTVGILVKFPWLTRRTDLTLDSTTTTAKIQIDWTAGSWGEDIADRVDGRISGKTADSAIQVFSTEDGLTQDYVRSTDCWLHGLDVTCVSPWNDDTSSGKMAGTLVTARHVLFAAHYVPADGSKLLFVAADGTTYERTLSATVTHPSYNSEILYPDLEIGVLDSDLPTSITPAKVLPDTWSNYVTKLGYRLPIAILDQESKALVTDAQYLDDSTRSTRRIFLNKPKASDRIEFWEKRIDGDSGSPVLLLTTGAPILVGVLSTSTAGTAVTAYKSDINTMISDADTAAGNGGTGYTLIEADLSAFTDFSI